jgi:hypothetical protein
MVYECPDLVAELKRYLDEFTRAEERYSSTRPPRVVKPLSPEGAQRLLSAIFDRRDGLAPADQDWLDDLYNGYVEPTEEEHRADLAPKATEELLAERRELVGEIIYFALVGGDKMAHKMLDGCVKRLKLIDDVLRDR